MANIPAGGINPAQLAALLATAAGAGAPTLNVPAAQQVQAAAAPGQENPLAQLVCHLNALP